MRAACSRLHSAIGADIEPLVTAVVATLAQQGFSLGMKWVKGTKRKAVMRATLDTIAAEGTKASVNDTGDNTDDTGDGDDNVPAVFVRLHQHLLERSTDDAEGEANDEYATVHPAELRDRRRSVTCAGVYMC